MSEKVLRYPDPDAVAEAAAEKLVDRIAKLQQDPDRVVQLCLTGGRIANRLYIKLAQHAGRMDSGRVEFWWGGDERFVPTDDPPDRNAGQTLVALGGSVTFNPALVHPMPAADGAPPNRSTCLPRRPRTPRSSAIRSSTSVCSGSGPTATSPRSSPPIIRRSSSPRPSG